MLLEPYYGKAVGCTPRTPRRRVGRVYSSNPVAVMARGLDHRSCERRRWLDWYLISTNAATSNDARVRSLGRGPLALITTGNDKAVELAVAPERAHLRLFV